MNFYVEMICRVCNCPEWQAEFAYRNLCVSGFDFSECTEYQLATEAGVILMLGGY